MTNDANKVLYILYREYADRVKHGFKRSSSKSFGGSCDIQKNFFPEMHLEDLDDVLRELSRNGFVDNFYADNTVYLCSLSDKSIATIESLPKNALKSFVQFSFELFKLISNH